MRGTVAAVTKLCNHCQHCSWLCSMSLPWPCRDDLRAHVVGLELSVGGRGWLLQRRSRVQTASSGSSTTRWERCSCLELRAGVHRPSVR